MNNSREANTAENKEYIEGRVREIVGEPEGLSMEWEDPDDKTMGTYNLTVSVPEHDPVVITFETNDLRWKTYYPDAGQDVEDFLKDEKELQPNSYNRKQRWDERIRQALSGFGGGPIGFSS